MADIHQESAGADFDLTQFYQIFFEEAAENLDQMEQMLLNLDLEAANDEELNGIFRCAHSIKGGAATFGFADVAELTHQMESLLDRLRRHELRLIAPMVDVLLESADASRSLLARHQAGGQGGAISTHELVRSISALAAGDTPVMLTTAAPQPVPEPALQPAQLAAPVAADGVRALEIHIGPLEHPAQADAIKELFRDIPGLGQIDDLPHADAGMRRFAVQTASSDDDLLDLFAFHVAKDQVRIVAAGAAAPAAGAPSTAQPQAQEAQEAAQPYGFFAG
ncbi:MAG TPA: Hpt domain-containing protein, partial [Alicycliphilus sp.]|nr:Hpt domain-containing protein [Alicycliphilus sp.]